MMGTQKKVVGDIGEKLVEIELLKRDINFWEMSGENPYFDLIIDTKEGLKKVQIKTSKCNNNFKKKVFQFFLKNCKDKYDFLICVGILNKNYKESVFYVIPRKELKSYKGNSLTGFSLIFNHEKKYSKFKENWGLLL